MESYTIKDLYITAGNKYLWESAVRLSTKNTIVVKAPEKSGKSFLCRDEALDFINYMDPESNILYYSSKAGEAARLSYSLEILLNRRDVHCDLAKNETYITEDQYRDTALFAPTSVDALAKLLTSGYRFQEVILDDAEDISATMIHTALLKAKVDDAKFVAIGSEETVKSNKKNLFTWLMNSPCADAYLVHRSFPLCFATPESLMRGTESLAEHIKKMFSDTEVEVA